MFNKRDNPKCELWIGHVKIKQLQNINSLNRKCDTEIRRRIGIVKDAFWNLKKLLRENKISLETKIVELLCNNNPSIWQWMLDKVKEALESNEM